MAEIPPRPKGGDPPSRPRGADSEGIKTPPPVQGAHIRRTTYERHRHRRGPGPVGIIAAICGRLADHNVNILDISQTILQGSFTMVMAVDLAAASAPFGQLSDSLAELGREMGLSIRVQREEIFRAMHTI